MIDHAKVLQEGEALMAELERREKERVALRAGQKCVHWTDARGVDWSRWEWTGEGLTR